MEYIYNFLYSVAAIALGVMVAYAITFSVGCGSNVDKYTECPDEAAQQCDGEILQTCVDNYWLETVDCSILDGGTCCEDDGGVTCCIGGNAI